MAQVRDGVAHCSLQGRCKACLRAQQRWDSLAGDENQRERVAGQHRVDALWTRAGICQLSGWWWLSSFVKSQVEKRGGFPWQRRHLRSGREGAPPPQAGDHKGFFHLLIKILPGSIPRRTRSSIKTTMTAPASLHQPLPGGSLSEAPHSEQVRKGLSRSDFTIPP